jgi:uncharacterized membrane protein
MSDQTAEAGSAKRGLRDAPRWVKGALYGSLALNMLVLGLGAGAMWHLRTGQAVGGGNLYGNLVAYSQSLPANRRRELGALIGDTRQQPEHRAQRQAVRAARQDVMRLFKADPFDIDAFRAAEARAAAAEARLREFADGQAAGIAKQLTAAERAAFLKWRELRRGRRFPAEEEPPAKAALPKTP